MALTAGTVVLIVEDDDGMRVALERLLHASECQTVTYASAEALLAAGAVPGAACVVSDYKLPAMSGLELLSDLRARGGWPPVIMITAHDTPALRAEANRRGASAYLAKPFMSSELLAAIQIAVDAGRPH